MTTYNPAQPEILTSARCTDGQRTEACDRIRTAHSRGMITGSEQDTRLAAAYAATKVDYLRHLVSDIPIGGGSVKWRSHERYLWRRAGMICGSVVASGGVVAFLLTAAAVQDDWAQATFYNVGGFIAAIVWAVYTLVTVIGQTFTDSATRSVLECRATRKAALRNATRL